MVHTQIVGSIINIVNNEQWIVVDISHKIIRFVLIMRYSPLLWLVLSHCYWRFLYECHVNTSVAPTCPSKDNKSPSAKQDYQWLMLLTILAIWFWFPVICFVFCFYRNWKPSRLLIKLVSVLCRLRLLTQWKGYEHVVYL